MKNNCTTCGTSFVVSPAQETFLGHIASVVLGGGKVEIPAPTNCPQCRQQRRISWRNDSNYYRRVCAACGKAIVSIYSPEKPYPVVCSQCFWSDACDAVGCGRIWSSRGTFFEQLKALQTSAPRLTTFNTQSENSEYTVHSSKNRNCYMDSSLVESEDVCYSDWTIRSRDCIDLTFCTDCEMCYDCLETHKCYQCDSVELCTNVSDAVLCYDCQGSSMLIGCIGQRSQKNMILNEPATPEACKDAMRKWRTDTVYRAKIQEEFAQLKAKYPRRAILAIQCEGCTGNYISRSKNAQNTYHCELAEDCSYIYEATKIKDAYDCMRCSGCELLYECSGVIDLKSSMFCNLTYQCDHLLYCDNCHGCSYCFGCISLKKRKYCILNKQYTKEEYEALVPKIIARMRETGEWGEFFPVTLSPFSYNETKAQDWLPLTKDAVLKRGWSWLIDEHQTHVNSAKYARDFPFSIDQVPESITQEILLCEATQKPFKIIPQELRFYKKKGLPLPRLCPKQRRIVRQSLEYPSILHARACHQCKESVTTTYPPNAPETVYCEKCYLATVA